MKKLNEPLKNGLIPIIEIAKMIFCNTNEDEPEYVNFHKPEFDKDGKLLVSFVGDKNGCGLTEWLFFDNNQFKVLIHDNYWTSDISDSYVKVIETNQIPLIKKLIEFGVMSKEEAGF